MELLECLASRYQLPYNFVSVHPRTQHRIDQEAIKFSANIRPMKPMGLSDYVRLMVNARATLSDSGTITESFDSEL